MSTQNDSRGFEATATLRVPSALIQRVAAGVVTLALFSPAFANADVRTSTGASAEAAALSEQESERQAEAISRSIMSPFCPGRTVSSCPNAQPWRDDIRKWVREGVDSEEIKRRLAERVPKHELSGIPRNPLGWVLPVGLGVGALASLVLLLRYLVTPRRKDDSGAEGSEASLAAASASPAKGSPDDWDTRLDQELETLER
jgi:cytochrome c-type biogenesis protein CcmH/NrfF